MAVRGPNNAPKGEKMGRKMPHLLLGGDNVNHRGNMEKDTGSTGGIRHSQETGLH